MKENKYIIEKITPKIFPNIYGNNKIKEALIIQYLSEKQFNILLIGDPSVAKTKIINQIKLLEEDRIEFEKNSGLNNVITKTKDYLFIDRFDILGWDETISYMQTDKKILAVANPRFGRFDPYDNISNQIDLSPSVISKFDLIFIIRDIPDKKKDELIAEETFLEYLNISNQIKPKKELLSYLNSIKEKKIKLDKVVLDKTKEFYVNLRNYISENDDIGVLKRVPITARMLQTIYKLTSSYAKLNQEDKAKEKEVENAIDMLKYCLNRIGVDPKIGKLDADRLESGISSSTRLEYKNITKAIKNIEEEGLEASIELIITRTRDKEYYLEDYSKILDKLKQEGIIFELRRNVFKTLK